MKLSPIPAGAGIGLLAILVLAPLTGTALGRLSAARAEHARVAALAVAPVATPALLAPGLAVRGDAAAARAAMMNRLQALAKAGGVLVEETSAARAPANVAALRIRISGAEKAVVALTDALERDRPLMRLRSWRIEPVTGGGVRLIGDLVAAWQ
jgi:hypothetical protein